MSYLVSSVLSCLSRYTSKDKRLENGDLEAALKLPDTKPGCIFCNVDSSKGFDIVLEVSRSHQNQFNRADHDSKEGNVVVFRDRNPAAREHLLVVPLNHIGMSYYL